jgi:phospholipid/cholesterol/gamma-HCH transport system ATP-binding protein
MSSVRAIADKVTMLHDGQVQWSGDINDLESSQNPYLSQFLDGSAKGPIEAVR